MKYFQSASAFALAALAVSCVVTAAEPTDVERLKASLAKWEQVRQDAKDEYSYQVTTSSFTGFRTITTIKVRAGKVEERRYEVQGPPVPVRPGEEPAAGKPVWIETGKEIGSHKEGAAARTVDELYAEAAKVLAMELPEFQKRSLGIDAAGLLSYCFVRDTRIADDAPLMGVPPFQLLMPQK